MQNITWQLLTFEQLNTTQLYAILKARSAVFILEQNCPYQDIDDLDQMSLHLIAWSSDGQLAAYLRVVPPGLKYPEASLGRVITSQAARGSGIGKQLLTHGIAACREKHPQHNIRIAAQQYLEKFYQSFGFVTVSDSYLEDGIPHIEMLISL
ncbi:MAG: GNAT family N-acetyltransferase [Undibacterium sp.]|nr:GNAT family N-acetyltransferase [Undibacterium sp.]